MMRAQPYSLQPAQCWRASCYSAFQRAGRNGGVSSYRFCCWRPWGAASLPAEVQAGGWWRRWRQSRHDAGDLCCDRDRDVRQDHRHHPIEHHRAMNYSRMRSTSTGRCTKSMIFYEVVRSTEHTQTVINTTALRISAARENASSVERCRRFLDPVSFILPE